MKLVLRPILIYVSVISLVGCGKAPMEAPPAQGPMPVMTTKPEKAVIQDHEEFTGRLAAAEIVEIRPRITGYVQKVHFQAGSLVKKGDVLFTIDPRWNQAEHNRAKAATAQAKAMLDNATREAERAKALQAAKAISAEEAETRKSGLAVAQAALQVAEAAQESAALDLEYTQVKAPIAGRVSRAMQTEGNYVSGVAGFTTLLTTVVSVDPMHAYVSVPENRYLKLQKLIQSKKLTDLSAKLKITGEDSFGHVGKIESFDNQVDPTTGSIVLRGEFPNPEGALVTGAFCKMQITSSDSYDSLLVDEKNILTDQDKKYVLTVQGPVAKMTPVKLGAQRDGKRVVVEGLKAEDDIITSSLKMLHEGAPVMKLPPMPAGGAAASAN